MKFCAVLIAVAFSVSAICHNLRVGGHKAWLAREQKEEVALRASLVVDHLVSVTSDLRYLAQDPRLGIALADGHPTPVYDTVESVPRTMIAGGPTMVRTADPTGGHPAPVNDTAESAPRTAGDPTIGNWAEEARAQLMDAFMRFCAAKTTCNRIVLLDRSGREVVRVERDGGLPVAARGVGIAQPVDARQLADALGLGATAVEMVPLRVKMGGSGRGQSFVPILRLLTPVVGQEERKVGVLVLDFQADDLLHDLSATVSTVPCRPMLLTGKGFWIGGPPIGDGEEAAAARTGFDFGETYPDVWEAIQSEGKAQIETAAGFFTSITLSPLSAIPWLRSPGLRGDGTGEVLAAAGRAPWTLVTHIPSSYLVAQRGDTLRMILLTVVIAVLVLGFSGFWLIRAAAVRSQALEELHKSRSFLQDVVNGIADPLLVLGLDRQVLFANRAACERDIGRDPVQCGAHCYEVAHQRTSPCSDAGEPCPLNVVISTGCPTTVQHVQRRVDGEESVIDVSAWPILDEAGQVSLIIEFSRDVTERTRAEEAIRDSNDMLIEALQGHRRAAMKLEAMTEAAESASRAKSEFLANMSHEIRTPMTAILGFAENLLDTELPGSDRLNAIHTIRRNGEHLLRIINDVLDLSKIEASKLELERVSCGPRRIVEEVVAMMRVRSDDAALSLVVEQEGAIPRVIQTDPLRLRQIMVNLIGNALKFTERGGVRIVMRLLPAVREDEDSSAESLLRFDIIDTGIGMSPEEADRLFRPFVQGDSSTSRRFGGTGLGLSISKRMAHMLGGDITVTSQVGQGSTFSLTIATGPLEEVAMLDDAGDHETGEREQAPKAAPTPTLAGRVLLAEDGVDNQRLISFVLKKAGATVTIVINGQLAVEEAMVAWSAGAPYDVILMDMQMPVLDGYQATASLREKGYTGAIVALTAHAMASDREKCLQAGCDDYTTKPINREVLVRMVAERMGQTSASDVTKHDCG